MSKIVYHLGLAIAAFSGSLLLGHALSYPAIRTGAMLLWLALMLTAALFAVGMYGALRKTPDANGGLYFEFLQWPIGAIVLLLIGGVLGFQAG